VFHPNSSGYILGAHVRGRSVEANGVKLESNLASDVFLLNHSRGRITGFHLARYCSRKRDTEEDTEASCFSTGPPLSWISVLGTKTLLQKMQAGMQNHRGDIIYHKRYNVNSDKIAASDFHIEPRDPIEFFFLYFGNYLGADIIVVVSWIERLLVTYQHEANSSPASVLFRGG